MSDRQATERTESMTAATSSWDARTTSAGSTPHLHRPLSRTALAARSLTAVDRLPSDSDERPVALRQHTLTFATPLHTSCPAR